MANLIRIKLQQPNSDLVRISDVPRLLVVKSEHAARDLSDRLTEAIFRAQIIPRTEDGFPVTVADCIEKIKSVRCDQRLTEYIGTISAVSSVLLRTPSENRSQCGSEEVLRKQFASGIAQREHISIADLVEWFRSIGLDCEFSNSEGSSESITNPPISKILVPIPNVTIHSTKKRRGPLDPLMDDAIAKNGYDISAIWSLLQQWAEEQRPPLIGLDESGGIKFKTTNYGETLEPSILSRNALGERIRRRAKLNIPR